MWSSILTLALASPASSATVVLDGIYSTFKTGGSQNDVVDRALFKMRDDSHVELYRNGEVGQTTPISPDGVRLSQSFDFHDGVLSGCDGCDGVTGSVQANGDIVWSHGYTSRKDAPDISGVYYSFATGGSPSSVVDRFEARQAGNHVTFYRNGAVGQTTPIRAETATAGESYTVEGNTLSGAVTGTVDSNGDIVWSHGYTSRKQSSVPAPMDQLNKGGRAVIIVLSLIVVSLLTVSLLVIITLICKRRRARPLPVEVVGVQISALQISAPSAGTYDMRPNAAVQLEKGVV